MNRLIVILLVCVLGILPVYTQEQIQSVRLGDTITGKISNENYEIRYQFQGETGDVVILELFASEETTQLQQPEIVLYDGDNRIIATTADFFNFREAVLVHQLTYSGRYVVLVTRDDGILGDSVGEYNLRLIRAQKLFPKEAISGTALSAQRVNHYAVVEDRPFTVTYTDEGGELNPYIEAYWVEDGEMRRAATLYGWELMGGAITLDGSAADIHIITVGDSPFAFYFDDTQLTADYRLLLTLNE